MKVLMLGWEFPPYVSGGLGRHCYELTRSMAALGTDITFFMPKKGADVQAPGIKIVGISPRPSKTGKKGAKGGGVTGGDELNPYPINPYGAGELISPYVYTGEPPAPAGGKEGESISGESYPMAFFEAVKAYNESLVHEAVKHEFDVIHAHDWITMPAAVKLKKITGKPLVITVHSTEYDRTANIYPMEWILEIERQGVKHADRIIAVSKMTKQHLIDKHGADESKIRVVYNAVNPDEYKKDTERDGERIVLFAGRVTNQKGPIFFLRAAYEVISHRPKLNVKFVVCGKGDSLPHLIEEAIHMGLSGKVTFTGFIPDDDLVSLYNKADIYVLPSVSEPFGITVLEAMAARTPVIISKTSGVSEVVSHCFKVDFWDTQEMANKIVSILENESLQKCMTHNAEMEVEKFDWDEVAQDTIRVYRELM